MIELAKHIEVLLLENDCVIVPGLGGFIAHYRSSFYDKETREFCPPSRTIGFNPKLVMNDGLLVQSYMQAYNTDFPDATRKIEQVVEALKEQLYQEGHVLLNQVGTLYYNINGIYEFEPIENGFFTPSLYGLSKFTLPKRSFEPILKPVQQKEWMPQVPSTRKKHLHRRWMRNIAAVAASLILFFLFSAPVKNTYVDETNYASLGSEGLFEVIRSQSVASSVIVPASQKSEQEKTQATKAEQKKKIKNNVNTLKPITVKTEKVETHTSKEAPKNIVATAQKKKVQAAAEPQPATPKVSAPANPQKGNNHIIVASLTNTADAEKTVKALKQKGYADAQVIVSQGRYRVSLFSYAKKADAYQKIQELKKQPDFASAWVFTSK